MNFLARTSTSFVHLDQSRLVVDLDSRLSRLWSDASIKPQIASSCILNRLNKSPEMTEAGGGPVPGLGFPLVETSPDLLFCASTFPACRCVTSSEAHLDEAERVRSLGNDR